HACCPITSRKSSRGCCAASTCWWSPTAILCARWSWCSTGWDRTASFTASCKPEFRSFTGLTQIRRWPRNSKWRDDNALSADFSRFPAEHGALACDAPVIAGQRAGFADHTMTRHDEADRIASDRGADRAGGFWRAYLGGDVGVGGRAAER